jgi:hypothetical protein
MGGGGKCTGRSFIRRPDNGAVPNGYTLNAKLEALGVRPGVPSNRGSGEECLEEMLRFTQEKNIRVKFRQTRACRHASRRFNPYDKRMELDSSSTKIAGKRICVVYRKTKPVIHRFGNLSINFTHPPNPMEIDLLVL